MSQKQEMEIKASGWKFEALFTFLGFIFAILALRLFFLQIYQGERLKEFSDSNRFKKQLLIAPRGLILDRNRKVLAGNSPSAQLLFHSNKDSPQQEILQKISKVISIPVEKLQQIIDRGKRRNGPFHPVVLKKGLSLMEIHKLKQLYWDHAEIQVDTRERRIYPLKENGSQLLGFIGSISKREVQKFKKENLKFHLGDIVGKSGLEKRYDKSLKGKGGFSMLEVDAQNRVSGTNSFADFLKIQPEKGKDLELTIDKDLQNFASQAMKRDMGGDMRRADLIGPRRGSVLVMKTNGEILVMLSEPGFDPNILSWSMDPLLWQKWTKAEIETEAGSQTEQKTGPAANKKSFINKSFQDHYSPGSIFKPFIALAALQEGLITKETLIDSPGSFKLGRRVYHDHNPRGHGEINVVTAIEKSANTFFYQIADQIGIEKIHHYAQMFGFGQRTGLRLKGESQGLLLSPHWTAEKDGKKWIRGDTLNVSIGQGPILTTLLQMAVAYNAIATQGLMIRPFVVKKGPEGKEGKTEILDSLTDRIQREHFLSVKEGLKRVVQGERGTARRHRLPLLSFSGKTGTAQLISLSADAVYKSCRELEEKLKHHGWFISFAPSDKPEIVVAVFTENSCSGSGGSAPVARDIIQYYFKRKEMMRSDG